MRAVVQRVNRAAVTIRSELPSGKATGDPVEAAPQVRAIGPGPGLVVLLGVGQEDSEADADYLAEKIARLRIFDDQAGKMNLSVVDVGGAALVVSQFTLYGDVRRGRRPDFMAAGAPAVAEPLYRYFVAALMQMGVPTTTGEFGANMLVDIANDGPVTILIDSKRQF